MPDEAERPERGGSQTLLPLSIHHLLNQRIRLGVCPYPAGSGNGGEQRCKSCRCFVAELERR